MFFKSTHEIWREKRKSRSGFKRSKKGDKRGKTVMSFARCWKNTLLMTLTAKTHCHDYRAQYQDDKTLIKDAVKSGKIPMMFSWTLEDFLAAVTEDDTFKGISSINIKIIYDDQIERLQEKELKEAKKRQRLGENFSDLLYSIKEISPSSTWDDSKTLFEDSQEYRALDSKTDARELFEECVVHLKERLKERAHEGGRKGKKKRENVKRKRGRKRKEG